MVLVTLLGLSWFCSPLAALVLDFNNIKSSADVQGAGKVSVARSLRPSAKIALYQPGRAPSPLSEVMSDCMCAHKIQFSYRLLLKEHIL